MTRNRTRSAAHDLETEPLDRERGVIKLRRRRLALMVVLIAALLSTSANSMPQVQAKDQRWNEEFNTAGAKLTLKETERTRVNGRTVVAYNLFTSGLPHDTSYILWSRLAGHAPQAAAEAFINDESKVVSQLAIPERHIPEDPVNLRVLAGKGEPKQFAMISKDGRFRAFAEVVPFPIQASDGVCHLSVVMTAENYNSVFVSLTGFQPDEELSIMVRSDTEQNQSKAKASHLGEYNSAIFPAVKGKRSGIAQFSATAKSCKVSIEVPWGEGSYELQ